MGFTDLFRPRWKHSDYRVRKSFLDTISEESIILEIARYDAASDLRSRALSKISEQRSLVEVALTCPHADTRRSAASLVREQSLLRDLVTTSEDPEVRRVAVTRVSDLSMLAEIAQIADRARLKEATAAVPRIKDQKILEILARGDAHPNVRSAATKSLNDKALLATLAQEGDHPAVRATAVAKLSDQGLMRHILETESHEEVRKAAVLRLVDMTLVESIARSGRTIQERRAAIGRLDDRALLEDLAVNDPDDDIQDAACRRLEQVYAASRKQDGHADRPTIWEAVLNSPDPAERKSALLSFIDCQEPTEVLVLTGVAVLSDDPEVRRIALDRIVARDHAERAVALIRSWRETGGLLSLAGPMNAEHRMRAAEIEGDFILRGRLC